MKYLWLAVTPDKYELPLCVEETSGKLAKRLGIKPDSVISAAHKNRSGKTTGRKIVKVKYEELEEG